jgi:hypothetical protein
MSINNGPDNVIHDGGNEIAYSNLFQFQDENTAGGSDGVKDIRFLHEEKRRCREGYGSLD